MCGRFTLRTPMKDVVKLFDLALGADDGALGQPARFNIAPSQRVAAVRFDAEQNGRALAWLQWGLVPPWADDPSIGNQMINARAESVATKPAFREALRRRRCLVPADGFYEWKRQDGSKQPYYVRLKTERPFAFAGLWEHWRRGHLAIESCTIITTDANELVRPLHDRMPVIIDVQDFQQWLDPDVQDPKIVQPLLATYPADKMTAYPVSRMVNRPGFDAPECIERAAPDKTQGSLFD
jgi:putative SOS response-associated peptidase YedK